MRRIIIIGGGISGLAAAHRLLELSTESNEPLKLTLLEASPRLGGVIRTEHREGFVIEAGPDSFISEKPEALELAQRLGLTAELIETNKEHRRSFIVRHGKLRPVPAGFQLLAPSQLWPFLISDILSLKGKARLALDLFLPRGISANGTADESLADFVRRRLGQEALTRVAQPMIGGIYTADPDRLSLRATMPRFLEMEREHRSLIRALWRQSSAGTSGARYSLFLSFAGGMQTLTDRLAQTIEASSADSGGPRILLNAKGEKLALEPESPGGNDPGRWKVVTRGGETLSADAVCLALPPYASAELLRELDPALANRLEAIPFASTATVNLAYKRSDVPHPLNGFGFVVPFIEKRTLLACTFSSVKFAARAPAGYVLLRAFVGGALQPEMFELDDGEMIRRVGDDLRALLGISRPPLFAHVARWARSMPQYHVGHLERMEQIGARVELLKGLTLAGNAFNGPGIPDCIRSGEQAAERS
ncbi:MAG: protoporphyrinogen/coproporphyrinogen oxidase [Blastocatellia bacterium]|jgi:oxygen-dependent protoporphyrinogen oxidase|nr:protoporphyrinogen/coproporphyrinogen oxidase [Blastocatellia bacterium]